MSALLTFIAATLAGFSLLCVGVWLLAGLGWSLIAGGMAMLCIAGFVRRGMTSG